jgi:hypothetical protein
VFASRYNYGNACKLIRWMSPQKADWFDGISRFPKVASESGWRPMDGLPIDDAATRPTATNQRPFTPDRPPRRSGGDRGDDEGLAARRTGNALSSGRMAPVLLE